MKILNWKYIENFKYLKETLFPKLTLGFDAEDKFGGIHLKKSIFGSIQNFIFDLMLRTLFRKKY